jgi:hypothetical protein
VCYLGDSTVSSFVVIAIRSFSSDESFVLCLHLVSVGCTWYMTTLSIISRTCLVFLSTKLECEIGSRNIFVSCSLIFESIDSARMKQVVWSNMSFVCNNVLPSIVWVMGSSGVLGYALFVGSAFLMIGIFSFLRMFPLGSRISYVPIKSCLLMI